MRLLWLALLLATSAGVHAADCAAFPNLAPYVPECREARVLAWVHAYHRCAVAAIALDDEKARDAEDVAMAVERICKDTNAAEKSALGVTAMNSVAEMYRANLIALIRANRNPMPPSKNRKTRQM